MERSRPVLLLALDASVCGVWPLNSVRMSRTPRSVTIESGAPWGPRGLPVGTVEDLNRQRHVETGDRLLMRLLRCLSLLVSVSMNASMSLAMCRRLCTPAVLTAR
jgi:hypothetical protein